MIIYGWRTKELRKSPELGEPCVKCAKNNTRVYLDVSYFHIFWIPIFPYRKKMVVSCDDCNYQATPAELTDLTLQKAKSIKRSIMPPIYMFSGTILIVLLIAYFSTQGKEQHKQMVEYINNPQKGDVYYYHDKSDTTGYPYSFLKVSGIEGDSLRLNSNAFGYNRYTWKLDTADGFYNIATKYHIDQIAEMFEEDKITTVERDWDANSGFDQTKEYDLQELIKTLRTDDNN